MNSWVQEYIVMSSKIKNIMASNQQFMPVLISGISLSTFILGLLHYSKFSEQATLQYLTSFVLSMSSNILSFGLLMLLTAAYERTLSYQEALAICNILGVLSAICTFFSYILFLTATLTDIFHRLDFHQPYPVIVAAIIWMTVIIVLFISGIRFCRRRNLHYV
nr:hypothetical protein K-LCC10_0176 [Kaumoebavirus]